jgi:hypothetical protein
MTANSLSPVRNAPAATKFAFDADPQIVATIAARCSALNSAVAAIGPGAAAIGRGPGRGVVFSLSC